MQLLTSEKFITQAKFDSLLLIDKFTESCMKLDASILVQYIEEDDLFEDKGNSLFNSFIGR